MLDHLKYFRIDTHQQGAYQRQKHSCMSLNGHHPTTRHSSQLTDRLAHFVLIWYQRNIIQSVLVSGVLFLISEFLPSWKIDPVEHLPFTSEADTKQMDLLDISLRNPPLWTESEFIVANYLSKSIQRVEKLYSNDPAYASSIYCNRVHPTLTKLPSWARSQTFRKSLDGGFYSNYTGLIARKLLLGGGDIAETFFRTNLLWRTWNFVVSRSNRRRIATWNSSERGVPLLPYRVSPRCSFVHRS